MTTQIHLVAPQTGTQSDLCPTCGQPIAHQKFEELKARIESEEQQRSAEVEERMRVEVARVRDEAIATAVAEQERLKIEAAEQLRVAVHNASKVAAEKLAEVEEARRAAEERVTVVKAEQEGFAREAEERLLAAVDEARKSELSAAAQKVAELEKQRTAAEEQLVVLTAEQDRLKEEAAEELRVAVEQASNAASEKIAELEEAKLAAEEQAIAVAAVQDELVTERLAEQRAALEKDKIDALNAERAKNFEENQKVQGKIDLLQRQLQKKTAEELGEGAEVDLFEALREAFPDDSITRVVKGKEGADIHHKVFAAGRECGSIVYDSKNRTAWRNDYVTKLRKDQLAAKAEHGVLASIVFPAGAKQLHLQDGVIVCNPARVVVVVDMLRKHIVQAHVMRLSVEERTDKTSKLYDFITSGQCGQLIAQIEKRSEDILDLDVSEKKAHDSTWKKRGELVRAVQRAELDLSSSIDAIIGGQSAIRAVK